MKDLPPSYDTINQGPQAAGTLPGYNTTWGPTSSHSQAPGSNPASESRVRVETPSSVPRNTLTRRRPQADDDGDGDASNAPVTYPIGKAQTQPLVFISEVRGHLALLRAFTALRTQIDAYDADTEYAAPLTPSDKERRWAWFVGLAVERFSVWCSTLTEQDGERAAEDFLPPLDVLMVWHTYMLNPGWYAEDRVRDPVLRYLTQVGPIFSSALSFQLEKILVSEPTTARLHAWGARTSRAFDPLEDALLHPTKEIRCPKCRRVIEAAYMDTTCTGYLQQNFFVRCTAGTCRGVPRVTKAVLGARKLAEDLTRQHGGSWTYLAGTLRTPINARDPARGKRVKKLVLAHSRFAPPRQENDLTEAWIVSVLEKNKYELGMMQKAIAEQMSPKSANLVRRILSAYTDGERFSLDLVGAVIRQGSFVKKMHELQWTDPHFFESKADAVALHHAIARYHGFLDLLASSPDSVFVPTLDIDLVWHTHQLMGPEYNGDCKTYVGRYIDHDDKVEEDALATAFDTTCRAWEDRFNLPYTYCGCPLPGPTLGAKLSFMRSLTIHKHPKTPPHLKLPATTNPAATHPSDHNAVFLFHRRNAGLEARERRLEKRWKDAERHGKGTGTPAGSGAEMGVDGHDPAFMMPVPMYFTYPKDVVCAAMPGNVVNNPGKVAGGECAGGGMCVVTGQGSTVGTICGVGGGGCRSGRWGGA